MRNLDELQATIETALSGRPGSVLVAHSQNHAGFRVCRALRVGEKRWEQECFISYSLAHSPAPAKAIAATVAQDLENQAWQEQPEVPLKDGERFRNEFIKELMDVLKFQRTEPFMLHELIDEVRKYVDSNLGGYNLSRCP